MCGISLSTVPGYEKLSRYLGVDSVNVSPHTVLSYGCVLPLSLSRDYEHITTWENQAFTMFHEITLCKKKKKTRKMVAWNSDIFKYGLGPLP